MRLRASVVALGLIGGVVVGGAAAYAATDQARAPEESAAIERLEAASTSERDRRLVAWIEDLTAPKPAETGKLEVGAEQGGQGQDAPRPGSDPQYLKLLEARQALTHEIAALWAPSEKSYQSAEAEGREALIVGFVSDNRSALEKIKAQIEELDRQIDENEGGR